MSEEHRAKIAAVHLGKKRPWSTSDLNPAKRPEVRAKISAAMKGRVPKRILRLIEEKERRAAETALCECGCGTVIKKWRCGNTTRLNRFATGHQMRGKPRPDFAAWVKANGHKRRHPKGASHWNWKGGISPAEKALRKSPEYVAWRDAVYRRDGWYCTSCGMKCQKRDIAADHVLDWKTHPALRFDVSNGRTLCRRCHAVRHGLGLAVRGSAARGATAAQ